MKIPCVALLLTAFASLHASNFVMPAGDDDSAASRAFVKWNIGLGYKPEQVDAEGDFVLVEGYTWNVELKSSEVYLDRLIFTGVFTGLRSNLSNAEATAFVNDLNSRYNIGSFNVDRDGDIVFQFTLAFDEVLTPAAYRKFIKSIEFITGKIIEDNRAQFDRFTK